jgi:hypothetical protein
MLISYFILSLKGLFFKTNIVTTFVVIDSQTKKWHMAH